MKESIVVRRPPDFVWDYTQDFSRRAEWDSAVLEAEVVESTPVPRARIRGVGGLHAVLQHRQFDRLIRTSLVMEDVRSALVVGGGGSWSYEKADGGTLWTQTNTIVLKDRSWSRLLAPLIRWQFRATTRRAMATAKQRLEVPAR